MTKHKRPFDQNLVDIINKLNWPLVNSNGVKVFLRKNARNETGAEHIAGKLHELKVRDIEIKEKANFILPNAKESINSHILKWWLG